MFDGLIISRRRDLCDAYLGKFPVVFLTLKSVEGLNFEKAKKKLLSLVAREADKFNFLKDSDRLTDNEKERYCALVRMSNGKYSMDEDTLESALQTLSELLFQHYGQKVIILIDEYDVPLDKAYQNGYYREMVSLIRSLFGNALKTNNSLKFAVLTGCLRITKESVFTGLNNFKIYSITSTGYLTTKSGIRENPYQLMIPNQEIRGLFIDQIRIWFKETSRANKETISTFCSAFPERNAAVIETLFDDYLWNMISVRDNATKEKKENFYHGILLGLLRFKENWIIKSNAESGIGYSDILIKIPENRIGIVIELKYADDRNLDAACDKALAQIEDQQYAASLEEDGMKTIIKYGIACYKKECKVKLG